MLPHSFKAVTTDHDSQVNKVGASLYCTINYLSEVHCSNSMILRFQTTHTSFWIPFVPSVSIQPCYFSENAENLDCLEYGVYMNIIFFFYVIALKNTSFCTQVG